MFQNNPYFQPVMQQPQAYQRQIYPQQTYQQPMMQDGTVQARLVSGREEAMAATVIPGSMFLFFDRANRKIYSKLIDLQTGMPDFREYGEMQPEQLQQPQYITMEALSAFRQEMEQNIEQRFAALTAPRQSSRKAVTSNDE